MAEMLWLISKVIKSQSWTQMSMGTYIEEGLSLIANKILLGLFLPTKKTVNIFVFWQNFLFSVNSHRIFKLGSYEKLTEKIAS
jgi:hypothetical protein